MIHLEEKWEQLPGKEECQMGSAVYKEGVGEAQNEKEEGQIQADEHQKGGYGVRNEIEKRQSRQRCTDWDSGGLSQQRSTEKGRVRSAERIIEAPVGIEELPSHAEGHGNGGIECGMGQRSANPNREDKER